jgi:hypothetical protein
MEPAELAGLLVQPLTMESLDGSWGLLRKTTGGARGTRHGSAKARSMGNRPGFPVTKPRGRDNR